MISVKFVYKFAMEVAVKDTPKPKRGRPRKVTIAEAQRCRREEIKRYRRTMVGLSSAYQAWNELRKRGKWTHGQLASHLLDVHARTCRQPNCYIPGPTEDATETSVKGTEKLQQKEIRPTLGLNEIGARYST